MSTTPEHPKDSTDRITWLRMDRKRFIGLTAAGGMGMFLAACGGGSNGGTSAATTLPLDATVESAVLGATPGERAINGIKALGLPADTTITIFSEDLSILAAEITKAKFEEQSGIKLNVQKAPFGEYAGKVLNDATIKGGEFDVVMMETNRIGDLDNAGYLADLTEWVIKYDPDIPDYIAPQGKVWSQYNGKYVGLPIDGDVFMFYYRKDLLEDAKEQKAFSAKYGRDLAVPNSYDEYNEVVEFFTRPDDKLFGAVEWRVKGVTYWWFWQRLWSAGGTYFNEDMTAAINSEAGIKALEDMKGLNSFMPPDILSYGYMETIAAMQNGTAFSNITWPAAGKNINDPSTSKTVGKWGYATVPGYEVDGALNPKSMSAPGYDLIVSNHAKVNKEAAYLYCQWLSSAENLIEANNNPKGNTDVIRESIFNDPAAATAFAGADVYLLAQKANLAQAVPDPIIPGYGEYTQALEIEISNFMTDSKSAKEALDNAAEKWNEITEGFGKDAQLAIWSNFQKVYSGTE